MQRKDFSKLNQMLGHKIQLSYYSPSLLGTNITYVYGCFNYEVKEDDIMLFDELHSDCKTYIRFEDINEVTDLKEDLYNNVINLVTNDFILAICCDETRPIVPKCYHCGNEIQVDETIWHIRGVANYGSHYDDEGNTSSDFVNGLNFCDDCISAFVGDI